MNLIKLARQYTGVEYKLRDELWSFMGMVNEEIDERDCEDYVNTAVWEWIPEMSSYALDIVEGRYGYTTFHIEYSVPYEDYSEYYTIHIKDEWVGLGVGDIVDDILKESAKIDEFQKEYEVEQLKKRAEELGLEVVDES